jgi:hypothetical protein
MEREDGDYTLAPSGAGNGTLSNTVIDVFAKRGFWDREKAVERPNAPEPMIRMEGGGWYDILTDKYVKRIYFY